MTDRGLPIIDGAPACPFVAFDDDREDRASGPDARHRCYAEVRPAPRAEAHQDAYCLSSAFALCPTFQDWAKRESARVRDEPRAESLVVEEPPRRNPQRGWAAPPPWSAGPVEELLEGRLEPEEPAAPPDFVQHQPTAGLAGSLAHQIAMDGTAAPPPPGREPLGAQATSRWERPTEPAAVTWPAAREGAQSAWAPPDDEDDEDTDDEAVERDRERAPGDDRRRPIAPARAAAAPMPDSPGRGAAILPGRGRPKVGDTRPRRRSGEPSTPPWERPHRYEAYPTLRTRMGLPPIPRLAGLAAALVVAMLGLFMLPGLLGLGSPTSSPTPVPSPSRSAAPAASLAPSIAPGPSTQVYVVQPGDTFSKIAARFGVPLADLIAANKEQFPNPDRIVVGDTVVIPAPLPSTFPNAGSAAPAAP